jgi:hypothetical protein
MKEKNENKYYYITYPSETVVFDRKGKRIAACPIEEEAVEDIKEMEQSEKNTRKDEA